MNSKLSYLKQYLDESNYTVALCGSGMMEEGGVIGVKKQERAYEIEKKYGYSAEELFSSAVYNARPELFFDFYKKEMLHIAPLPTQSGPALAALEKMGKLQCIVDSNIYEMSQQAGCTHVINLHGSIHDNQCPRCKKKYPLEYMMSASRIPLCGNCKIPVRPMVSLFGEQVDSQRMTKTTEEIARADMLLVLGSTLNSEVFRHYTNYFDGKRLVIIHQRDHFMDHSADLVIISPPSQALEGLMELYQSDKEA